MEKQNYIAKEAAKYRIGHRCTLQPSSKHSLDIIFSIKKGSQ